MTTTDELQKSHLVTRYLADLEIGLETTGIAAEEREAIAADIADHISAEIEALPADADIHSVELILQRLGTPASIAAESVGAAGVDAAEPIVPLKGFAKFRMTRGYAAMVVLILALGGVVIPLLGWLAGVVFLWMSNVWRVRDKVIGTLVLPGGFGFILLLGIVVPPTVTSSECTSSSTSAQQCTVISEGPPEWFGPTLLAVLILLQVASAIYLYRSFSKRTPAA